MDDQSRPTDTSESSLPESSFPDASMPDTDTRALVISRVVDGAATPGDWAVLRTMASADAAVWADLADTQTRQAQLAGTVRDEVMIADGVELPNEGSEAFAAIDIGGVNSRIGVVRSWGGWAAAAVLLLVWATGIPIAGSGRTGSQFGPQSGLQATPQTGPQTAGFSGPRFVDAPAGPVTSSEALQQYIDLGRADGSVIAAMPEEVVLETRALGDGSAEVLYLRQILERRVVDQFYRLGTDELGRPVPVRDFDAQAGSSPF